MKNIFKRIIIAGVFVLTFGVFNNVYAQPRLSLSNPVKSGDTTSITVKLNFDETDTVSKIKFKCDSGNMDIKCSINSSYLNKTEGNGDGIFIQDDSITYNADGIRLATLTLKNGNQQPSNDNTLTINSIYINDAPIDDLVTKYSVGVSKVVNTDSTIKNMTVSQGAINPSWDPSVYDYVIYNIADTINSIKFNHICNATGCSVKYDGGKSVAGQQVSLNMGENNITLLVTAEDGKTTSTYNFIVYRGESSFNSSKIRTLSIGTNKLDPEFDKEVYEYKVTVANDVTSIKDLLQYELIDPNASIEIKGDSNLVVGDNTCEINVTSSLGDNNSTYKIVITRMDNDEIDILKYIDGKITFKDSKGEEQTLSLADFKNKYPKEYKKIVNRSYKFDDEGNIIKEEKEESKKGLSKTTLLILIIIGGLIIIGVAGFFIFKKPSDKSKKKDLKKSSKKGKDDEEPKEVEEEKQEDTELGEKFSDDEDTTVSIDVALNDLMNTKQYEFEKSDDEEKEDK